MDIREHVIKVLSSESSTDDSYKLLQQSDDLLLLEMNSISFIKAVVELEEIFGIEFDDEKLNFNENHSLDGLCNYIESLMER